MSDSITSIIARARSLLKESPSQIWSDSELSECAHQALDDINQAAGQSWVLAGLDSAAETDLPAGLASLLARGAAAYALFGLAAARADLYNFQPGVCQAHADAGAAFLKQFLFGLAYLNQVRLGGLQTSVDAPYPSTVDEQPSGWQLDD